MKIEVDRIDLYNMASAIYMHEQDLAKKGDKKYENQWYDMNLDEWKAKAQAAIEGLNRR